MSQKSFNSELPPNLSFPCSDLSFSNCALNTLNVTGSQASAKNCDQVELP